MRREKFLMNFINRKSVIETDYELSSQGLMTRYVGNDLGLAIIINGYFRSLLLFFTLHTLLNVNNTQLSNISQIAAMNTI